MQDAQFIDLVMAEIMAAKRQIQWIEYEGKMHARGMKVLNWRASIKRPQFESVICALG